MAPQACLEEAGAEYEMVQVRREGYTVVEPEGYLALQPEGRIPALRDGDLVLHESAAICMYIADRFPESGLLPPVGTRARARLPLDHVPHEHAPGDLPDVVPDRPLHLRPGRPGRREARPRAAPERDLRLDRLTDRRPSLPARRHVLRRRSLLLHAHPLGAQPAPEGVDAALARRALPAAGGAAAR